MGIVVHLDSDPEIGYKKRHSNGMPVGKYISESLRLS